MDKFIIAEIGVNHDGSYDKAIELVKKCKSFGASAVKFQHFYTDEIVQKDTDCADYQKDNGNYSNQYDMIKELELSDIEIKKISEYCEEIDIEFMATPFCVNSLNFLVDECGMKRIKIGSGEIINHKLLFAAGTKSVPVILSTGMALDIEIELAISQIIKGFISSAPVMHHDELLKLIIDFKKTISILHCTTAYPCPKNEANLGEILRYKLMFPQHEIGFSDHTADNNAAMIASSMGANIFEKHVTYDKSAIGPDHKASLNINDFRDYINAISLGKELASSEPNTLSISEEKNIMVARRSLHKIDSKIKASRPYDGDSIFFEE